MRWRILKDSYDGAQPINHFYRHPWEAELVMLRYGFSGWVQGFRAGSNRTHLKDWYRVDPFE